MTTQTPFPKPAGPFEVERDERATDSLEPTPVGPTLDALTLLDQRTRARTIPPQHALRGTYLALESDEETRLLRIDQQILHFGRGPDADVRFEEHHVSRDHAILVRHGRFFRLLDNRSANGTFVNGRQIVATNVSDGDVIRIGPVAVQLLEVA